MRAADFFSSNSGIGSAPCERASADGFGCFTVRKRVSIVTVMKPKLYQLYLRRHAWEVGRI